MNNGTIYLIPVAFNNELTHSIPEYVKTAVADLDEFIVENERSARRYLRKIGYAKDFDQVVMHLLNKRTEARDLRKFLNKVSADHAIGLMSEAGCPGIADPGAEVIRLAHQKNITVKPLVGPSSILLALIGSGLNGQHFTFHGYLPIDRIERSKKIKTLEQESLTTSATQIFMETPYRNNRLIEDVVKTCYPETHFCIACDLTYPEELIQTKKIKDWKGNIPDIHKRPAIFLINGKA